MKETFYNYPVFYAHIFRGITRSSILSETKFLERSKKALKNWELAIHYELGLLLTMLDREGFLFPLMRHCYPENRYSNLLYKGTFSEVKLFDYHLQELDRDNWSDFNLATNTDFELDIAVNLGSRFFIDVEIKHNESFTDKVLGQMYRKCAFLLSPYQCRNYGLNSHLFIAWEERVKKSDYFIQKDNRNYHVLTEELKEQTIDGIMEKSKDKTTSFKSMVVNFIESDGVRLITWERIKEFIDRDILSQDNVSDSITQSCAEFVFNFGKYYTKIDNAKMK